MKSMNYFLNIAVVALAIAFSGIVGCGGSDDRNLARDFVAALNDASGGGKRFSLIKSRGRIIRTGDTEDFFSVVIQDNTPGRQRTVAVMLTHDRSLEQQVFDYLDLSNDDLFNRTGGIAEFVNFFDVDVDVSCTNSSSGGDPTCTTHVTEYYIGLATSLVYDHELSGKNTLAMDEFEYNSKVYNIAMPLVDRYTFSEDSAIQTAEVLLMNQELTASQAANTMIQDYVEVKLGYDANDLKTSFQNRDFDTLSRVVQGRTYATPEGMNRLKDDVIDVVTGN